MNAFFRDVRVGLFLGVKQFQRANRSTTLLIIFIMALTFLNMVVVSGILVGLIEGGNRANKEQYTGDVFFTTRSGKSFIDQTFAITETLKTMPFVKHFSVRFIESGTIEANYQTRRNFEDLADTVGTQITTFSLEDENAVSRISQYVVEGEFLEEGETGYVVIGANLLRRYSSSFGDGFASLDEVYPGDKVKITVGNRTREMIVKGIIDSKVNEVSLRAFVSMNDFLSLVDRPALQGNEIAIVHDETVSPDFVKASLVKSGFPAYAKIQTASEAIPDFLNQIKIAFSLLGNIIGAIGIMVASITIFIVIFINAVTRRKYIGILKGIGISGKAIQYSYIFQSMVYAVSGSLIAIIIIYAFLIPAFLENPIDFPFSDGILVAPIGETTIRFIILLVITFIAGYVPAWMIIRKNTLDSILGRA